MNNGNLQSKQLRLSALLLLIAVVASLVARLTEGTTLSLAAHWLCALAFPFAVLLFALALPRQMDTHDNSPRSTVSGRGSTC